MIKAILFDMDGTITDTERIYNKKWVEAAHMAGYPAFGNEHALYLRSLNHADSEIYLKEQFGPDTDYDAIHDNLGPLVDAYVKEHGVPLKPGVFEILEYLKENKIKHAVVTATGMQRARARLTEVGLFDKFDTVISAHQVPKGKPYPDPYLFACETLNEKPADCIAVEDSPNGVLSAYRAGCKVIMVPDLTEPDDDLRKLLYACVPSLDKIADVISRDI